MDCSEKYRPLPSLFTLAEVKLHSRPDDLWMIIYNKIYDVTKFAQDHPGGVEVLFDCAGVDATEAFEDVAHSEDAFNMLLPYFVGSLHDDDCVPYSEIKEHKTGVKVVKEHKKKPRKPNEHLRHRMVVLFLVVLASCALMTVVGLQKLQWIKLTMHVP